MRVCTVFLIGLILFASCNKEPVRNIFPSDVDSLPETEFPIYFGDDTILAWKRLYHEPNGRYTGIQFPDVNTGYLTYSAFQNLSSYQKSIDGGKNWTVYIGLPPEANRLQFLSTSAGYTFRNQYPPSAISGQVPLSMMNPNDSSEWKEIFKSDNSFTVFTKIALVSEKIAYAITINGDIFRITDPLNFISVGAIKIAVVGSEEVKDFHFSDVNNGWVLTFSGDSASQPIGSKIYSTKNAGLTWDLQYQNQNLKSTHIFSIDQNHTWVACYNGFLITTDGGNSWKYQKIIKTDKSSFSPREIFFLNTQKGFAISTNEIMETGDGGMHWTRSCKDGRSEFSDIHFLAPNHLFAITSQTLYKLEL